MGQQSGDPPASRRGAGAGAEGRGWGRSAACRRPNLRCRPRPEPRTRTRTYPHLGLEASARLEVRSRGRELPVNSMAGEFLDSNVLVYAFTDDPRAAPAQMLLERGCTISVQCLNEFANVARRGLRKSSEET